MSPCHCVVIVDIRKGVWAIPGLMATIEPAQSFAASLAKSVNDSLFVEKMEAYNAWAAEEPRLQGWMPFHYYNRLWGPTPDRWVGGYPLNPCSPS